MARNTGARKVVTGAVAYRNGFAAETLAADRVLTITDSQRLRIDPGGAGRNIDLPGVGDEAAKLQDGEFIEIVNVGTGTLTVRQPSAGATVASVPAGDRGVVYWSEASRAWALHYVMAGGHS